MNNDTLIAYETNWEELTHALQSKINQINSTSTTLTVESTEVAEDWKIISVISATQLSWVNKLFLENANGTILLMNSRGRKIFQGEAKTTDLKVVLEPNQLLYLFFKGDYEKILLPKFAIFDYYEKLHEIPEELRV